MLQVGGVQKRETLAVTLQICEVESCTGSLMMLMREKGEENLLIQLGYDSNGGKRDNNPRKKDTTNYNNIKTIICKKNTEKVTYSATIRRKCNDVTECKIASGGTPTASMITKDKEDGFERMRAWRRM